MALPTELIVFLTFFVLCFQPTECDSPVPAEEVVDQYSPTQPLRLFIFDY